MTSSNQRIGAASLADAALFPLLFALVAAVSADSFPNMLQ
jgi:hypothetical protein